MNKSKVIALFNDHCALAQTISQFQWPEDLEDCEEAAKEFVLDAETILGKLRFAIGEQGWLS